MQQMELKILEEDGGGAYAAEALGIRAYVGKQGAGGSGVCLIRWGY